MDEIYQNLSQRILKRVNNTPDHAPIRQATSETAELFLLTTLNPTSEYQWWTELEKKYDDLVRNTRQSNLTLQSLISRQSQCLVKMTNPYDAYLNEFYTVRSQLDRHLTQIKKLQNDIDKLSTQRIEVQKELPEHKAMPAGIRSELNDIYLMSHECYILQLQMDTVEHQIAAALDGKVQVNAAPEIQEVEIDEEPDHQKGDAETQIDCRVIDLVDGHQELLLLKLSRTNEMITSVFSRLL